MDSIYLVKRVSKTIVDKILRTAWHFFALGWFNLLTPLVIIRSIVNKYGNTPKERTKAIASGLFIALLWNIVLGVLLFVVYVVLLIASCFLHLPPLLADISDCIDFFFLFAISILFIDNFFIPWLSKKVLGLQILRLYPASSWAIRLCVLLLLNPSERQKIYFPKCIFWEVHTPYRTRKPSKRVTFSRSLVRDMQKIDSYFRGFNCFYGHTPMPIEKMLAFVKPQSVVKIQGPFPSKTPQNRALFVSNKPAIWHVYLILTQNTN